MPAASLHCDLTGAGRSLVLLHPVGLDNTFWGPLVEAASRSHRLMNVDLRGHGRSPPAQEGMAVDHYADDVHAAIAHHRMAPAVVLGLSFGGMVAQSLAVRHSGDVAALLLCACPSAIPEDSRPIVRERGRAAQREGMAAVVEPTVERWFNRDFRSGPAADRVRERLRRNRPDDFAAAWHAIAEFDCRSGLGSIAAPTLVVAGEHDAATPLAASEALAAAIRDATIEVIGGAPHMMQIECADRFCAVVGAFLEHRG